MPDHGTVKRSIRIWIVTLVTICVLVKFALTTLRDFDRAAWSGDFGFVTNRSGIVTSVTPKARGEGLLPGDRIYPSKLSLNDASYFHSRQPLPGTTIALPITRDGTPHVVLLRARRSPTRGLPFGLARFAKDSAWLFFVGMALFILLRRPSRMTWGFYLYAVANPQSMGNYLSFLPVIPFYIWSFAAEELNWLALLGLVQFALRFPNDRVTGWRATSEKALPAVFVILTLINPFTPYGPTDFGIVVAQLTPVPFLYAWAWLAFIDSYRGAQGTERLRVRWAIFGALIGTLAAVAGFGAFRFNGALTFFTVEEALLAAANVIVPLSMGYAILRHRVIDVHFVLNRTIVFFAVGAAAIAVFAGFDWISANVLPLSRSQVALALAVAFIFGLLMPRYYGSLVALVDSVAFPKRRAATMRMNELRLAIEAHNDGQQTMHVLVRDACKALGLVSAAAFRAVPDGGFIREDSTGWPAGTTWHLLSTDRIVRDMSVPVNRPLRVRDQWPAGTNMPRGSARPILCCPIGNHGRPLALMFYGGHTDGAEIDPDEARALMKLCNLYGRDAFT